MVRMQTDLWFVNVLGVVVRMRLTCGLLDDVLVMRMQTDLWFAG